jgi:protoporphyrin/coproporphyrin ferrochelatase
MEEDIVTNEFRYKGLVPAVVPSRPLLQAKVAQQFQGTAADETDSDIDVRSVGPLVPQWSNPSQGKVGVMLLNLGGPDTLDDVQPFLYNLFADPDIIRLPPLLQFLQPIIAQTISTLRARKSTEAYRSIGGGSPLRSITQQQAEALQSALVERGLDAHCYVAMRYWHPYTEEAIEQIKADSIEKLVVLPLYPQFSISTSGSSLRLLEDIFKSDEDLAGLEHTVIPSWYARRGYVTAMADLIEEELTKFDKRDEVCYEVALLFERQPIKVKDDTQTVMYA